MTIARDPDVFSKPVDVRVPERSLPHIPFNAPSISDRALHYLRTALASAHLSGDGAFTQKCRAWLEALTQCHSALLVHSGTAALEMAALLLDIQPGDEVIMPSFTFVSTANAFVLRGAVPVFVDIRPDTLNLDESKIEAAITAKTKAIVPVHYAGVSCNMQAVMAIADQHQLWVLEDAAQAICSRYQGQPVGSQAHLAAVSFHETKNLISGEGGALLINHPGFAERAEIIREKGTNRSQFFRGEVDKYSWVDVGSSFLPSDLLAALLWEQFERCEEIQARRSQIWNRYHTTFAELEWEGLVRRPIVPIDCEHNAHMYYLLVRDCKTRTQLLQDLKARGIGATFHYVPLHSAPAGLKYGRTVGELEATNRTSDCILRLPLSPAMSQQQVEYVCATVLDVVRLRSAYLNPEI